MANLVFPATKAPYRGFVGEIRGWLRRIASYVEQSPASGPIISQHLSALIAQTEGLSVVLPSTAALVTNGQKITGVTGEGTVANIAVNPTTKAVTVTLSAS